jgi:hypothetical protein
VFAGLEGCEDAPVVRGGAERDEMRTQQIEHETVAFGEVGAAPIEDETSRNSVSVRQEELHHVVDSERPADVGVEI